jgi:type IV pilus assembly protein PilQ
MAGVYVAFALVIFTAQAADVNAKVSVDFKKAAMQDVADYMAVKGGVNIVVEKGVVGDVNLRLNGVEWLEALGMAAKQVGCTVQKDDTGIYHVTTPHFSFTTKSEGVSLKQVVSLLAQQSGQNIVVAPNVDAVVHFSLQDVPWQTALDTIVKTAGPFSLVRDEAGVYRVVKSDSLAEQKETRVFQLKYIQPPSEYKPKLTSEFAEKSGGGTTTTTKQLKDHFTLFKALNQVVADKGNVEYDFDSNSFIVTSTRPLLDEVANIIRLVDVQPDQVFIDVKFITTGYTDLLNAGVRYPKGFMISASGGSMVHRLPFKLGEGGWEDHVSVHPDSPTTADVDGALGGDSPYTFGVIDFTNISPILEFLKTDTKSEIVQAPQLTVVDNKTATVFVGEQIHFAEEFSTTNQGGQLSKGIREAEKNSPVKVGTQLLVMPHIVPDTSKIILQVIPTSEQLIGTSSPTVSGFERFAVADSFIDLPRLSSRTVVTTMMLQDGQTAVIGGLINQSASDTRSKLPFFGDLPIIGWLFKNKQLNTTVNNLYIFITVRIMRNDADVQTIFAEYDVPGARLKPYRPGAVSEAAGSKPAGSELSPDTVGKGWEETDKGVEKFEVKK